MTLHSFGSMQAGGGGCAAEPSNPQFATAAFSKKALR